MIDPFRTRDFSSNYALVFIFPWSGLSAGKLRASFFEEFVSYYGSAESLPGERTNMEGSIAVEFRVERDQRDGVAEKKGLLW